MRSTILSLAGLVLAGLASASGGPKFSPYVDTSIVAHTGKPIGKVEKHNNVTMYITKPPAHKKRPDVAILYLTDVFGIPLVQNKLLVDSFARAGYLTVAPDLFDGDPALADIELPGFNTTDFINRHGTDATDPLIHRSIAYLREELGIKRIGVPGYCFGGKYSFRFVAEGWGADVAFAAHPTLWTDEEVEAIVGPAAVAAAEVDARMSPADRAHMEALLANTTQPYQVNLYSQTSHGFAVRGNASIPMERFGKEQAFIQAVTWFDHFL